MTPAPRFSVLALGLAAWAGFGWAVQGFGGSGTILGLLPGAVLAALLAARPAEVMAWLTSVPFAALQLGLLAILAFARAATGFPGRGPFLCALLWLLAASTLGTAWSRRPYDRARMGFLLVHVSPALILLGLAGPRWLAGLGMAALTLGCPWMFYLKPLLKGKKAGLPPPAWERGVLQGTRILFLATGAVAAAPLAAGGAPSPWALVSWLILAVALHAHHVKGWKGPKAQFAGLVGWGLCLAAYLRLR